MPATGDHWAAGEAYHNYMGRWSECVALAFMEWLHPAVRLNWLDVGCGTGALTHTILKTAYPNHVTGCDPSPSFIQYANTHIHHPQVSFVVSDLANLPEISGGFDAVVSGLVLNFVPDPVKALQAMMNRAHPGALIAAYVWDYSGRMDFLRIFWDSAAALNATTQPLDEAQRFPFCQPEPLQNTFQQAGLKDVRTGSIDIPTPFKNFSDFWEPFLAGTGPAPAYVASLGISERNRLAASLKHRLEPAGDGMIEMIARAWVVRGVRD
jgi:SAM-dependent methyltransferase